MRLPTRLRRPLGLLAGAVLAAGLASTAAPASADTLPSAPQYAFSTSQPVVGTPMTATFTPGNASDDVVGYAWTWHYGGQLVYNAPASCSAPFDGTYHYVCGRTATVTLSPEDGADDFGVYAIDSAGNRSLATSNFVFASPESVEQLSPRTHQWTTDAYGSVPPATGCTDEAGVATCVPDSDVVDPAKPAGAFPLRLPTGVTWVDDGSWYSRSSSGELSFDGTHAATAAGAVVDTARSFTVGAWATPTRPGAVLAGHGPGGTGFTLRLNDQNQWEFDLASTPGQVVRVVSPFTASPGRAVYVVGVYDAVNHELRLYDNGGADPEAVVGAASPLRGSGSKGVVLVGDGWAGRIGNPVVVQAALPVQQQDELSYEGFFPNPNGDLN